MARYGTSNITETSFDFYAHGFSGDTSRRMCIKVGNLWRFTNTIAAWEDDPYNGQMTVSGLSPGTTYAIEVRIGTSTVCANNALMYTGSVTTEEKVVAQGCIVFDDMEVISSSYSNGTVTTKIMIYYHNNGATRDTATIYYQVGGNGYYHQSVSCSAYGDGYIECNMSINTGTLSTTSYTFNFNGYIDSSNCGNDHFGQNLTATWTAVPLFYWKTSTDRPAKNKEIADYITAAKWNSLCNSNKVNLPSLANKTSGVSKIIGTEVRKILLALGGSSSIYPLANF